MSEHRHDAVVEGCYRCELSRDEAEAMAPKADEAELAWAMALDNHYGNVERAKQDEDQSWWAQAAEVAVRVLPDLLREDSAAGEALRERLGVARDTDAVLMFPRNPSKCPHDRGWWLIPSGGVFPQHFRCSECGKRDTADGLRDDGARRRP